MKTIPALVLLSLLCACSGDGANPFGTPDETTQPVQCAASAACV